MREGIPHPQRRARTELMPARICWTVIAGVPKQRKYREAVEQQSPGFDMRSANVAPWVNDHSWVVYAEGVTQFRVVVAMVCETPLGFSTEPSLDGREQGE
jgi:hypothetical protein